MRAGSLENRTAPGQSRRLWFYRALLVCAGTAIGIAIFEGLCSYLMVRGLTHDSPKFLLRYFRSYYWFSHYRHVIQFDPACSMHDDEVFYTLKPGTCTHSGLRFNTTYTVNSLGVRDDEASLQAPQIVCVGDSHAMGWGIEQQDTYTQLVERQSGMRALNMGISSYGTVRELTLLKRVDLSQLKALVIQYNDNDLQENLQFLSNGWRLHVRPASAWQEFAEQETGRSYFPGRHLVGLLKIAFHLQSSDESKMQRQAEVSYDPTEHAGAFMEVLNVFDRAELQKAKILLFDVRNDIHDALPGASFAKAVTALKSSEKYQKFADRLVVLDLASELNGAEFRQIIDNHINETGHRRVAAAILAELARGK